MDVTHLVQVLVAGVSIGSAYALVALGFGIVYNGTTGVNFAQGEYVMAAGITAGVIHESYAPPLIVTVVIALTAGILLGLLTELLGVRWLRVENQASITVATIGFAVALKGAVMVGTQRRSYSLPPFTAGEPFAFVGAAIQRQSLWNVGMLIVAGVLLFFFFKHTRQGTAMRAAADDREMLASVGASGRRLNLWCFGLAGLLGAVAGVGLTPLTLMSFEAGTLLGLKGFAAAILGGLGHMYGAIAAGLLLGLLEAMFAGYVASAYADVVAFAVLLFVLFVRPTGILGELQVERV